MRDLGRILVPMITPFTKSGDVDYERAAELARRIIDNKLGDSVVVTGTTGEFSSLTVEERIQLFKTVHEAVGSRAPVIAGTGHSCYRETIRLTRAAEEIGVDCAMIVAPYYCKPDQEGIYRYYETVVKETSLPVMLYNIPIFTGVNIESDTLKRLTAFNNIFSIKEEAAANPFQTTTHKLATSRDFVVYDGDDTMVLQILIQGGAGVVSGSSQIVGHRVREMIDAFLAKDLDKAMDIHYEIFPLYNVFCRRINPTPLVRAALDIVGFPVGDPRLPLTPATVEERKALEDALKGIKGINL